MNTKQLLKVINKEKSFKKVSSLLDKLDEQIQIEYETSGECKHVTLEEYERTIYSQLTNTLA